jgi:hypothetical protein
MGDPSVVRSLPPRGIKIPHPHVLVKRLWSTKPRPFHEVRTKAWNCSHSSLDLANRFQPLFEKSMRYEGQPASGVPTGRTTRPLRGRYEGSDVRWTFLRGATPAGACAAVTTAPDSGLDGGEMTLTGDPILHAPRRRVQIGGWRQRGAYTYATRITAPRDSKAHTPCPATSCGSVPRTTAAACPSAP